MYACSMHAYIPCDNKSPYPPIWHAPFNMARCTIVLALSGSEPSPHQKQRIPFCRGALISTLTFLMVCASYNLFCSAICSSFTPLRLISRQKSLIGYWRPLYIQSRLAYSWQDSISWSDDQLLMYRSVPGKRPLPGKRPYNCFGCSNKKRPLPGKRPGNVSQDNIASAHQISRNTKLKCCVNFM